MAPPPNTNLYCAQCDSQIGIFENEWENLTSSYAKPKEKGISFGLEVGEKTQIVPNGSAQKAAEGCTMAEVFCKKCSTMVAQYCKSAPHPSKEYLVNQQFFKLSRVYLKDAHTNERIEPTFVEVDRASSQARPASVRSSIPPPPPPRQRARSAHEHLEIPSFRQSYPPPSHPQAFAAYQARPSPMPPSTQFEQTYDARPLASFAPLTNQYGQQQFYYQSSVPDYVRPMSANDVRPLPREVTEQGAAIAGCYERLASLDGRIASEATRTTALENRMIVAETKSTLQETALGNVRGSLEQLQQTQQNQASGGVLQNEIIQQQQTTIETQQEELQKMREKLGSLQKMSEKLESLQTSMTELRGTMEAKNIKALVQTGPRPDSNGFLDNLEVIVRAMRSARSDDEQVSALREENKAMKARLESIASAIGPGAHDIQDPLEGGTSTREPDSSHVLGKRKRALNKSDQEVRRLSRQAPFLPTPDSTQPSSRSLASSHQSLAYNERSHAEKERSLPDDSQSQGSDDDDSEVLENGSGKFIAQERATSAPGGTDDHTKPAVSNQNSAMSEANKASALTSNTSSTANFHQGHITNGLAPGAPNSHEGELILVPRPEAGLNHGWQAVPAYGPYAPGPWYSASVPYASRYHPSFNGRASMPQFISGPGVMPPYFGSTIFPPSAMTPGNVASSGQTSSLDRNDTFSGPLSRGQRLEEIIQRPRPSSVTNVNTSDKTDTPATVLQPRQRNLSEQPTEQASTKKDLVNAESIDFSDEENTEPVEESTTQPIEPVSTTPVGEPPLRTAGSTLVSRTVRGFTLEPLERPVLTGPRYAQKQKWATPAPRRSTGSRTATKNRPATKSRPVTESRPATESQTAGEDRPAIESRPASVMPEVMAAVEHLNSSAARHAGTPRAMATPSRSSSAARATNMPASKRAKKSRISEPIPHISVDIPNHRLSVSKEQSTPQVREESSSATRALNQIAITSKPSTGHEVSPAEKIGTPAPGPPTRGRPRKSDRKSNLQEKDIPQPSATPELAEKNNDDCAKCGKGGNVLCCDGCPKVYHHRCLNPPRNPRDTVEGNWYCHECVESRQQTRNATKDTAMDLQTRRQVLMERTRLAQEVMDRE
ncbi:hypothetical protein PMZ80_006952 [Knufia obscura]|uniref:PHD-type domain-containing protein n=2 Tax=Knufia TaxID=430999 RepID=A0AAN8FFC9_9EURO|nr:hypothetical protein PMZ80_006952 [Knufia obscura]KAK5957491.1 hypothetical protein OHC33_001866 [Knufia fluminis]